MYKIKIISSSIREGRKSHRIALFFKNFINENNLAEASIIDLKVLSFPVFTERLKYQKNPSPDALKFANEIQTADGVIIVTPEYNGGYPASLINAIDLLVNEWYHKPVAISTVSDGVFGGSQVITSLQFSLWKIKALTVTAMFPVPRVDQNYDETGKPADPESANKRADGFVKELIWFMDAAGKMNS